MRDWCLKCRVMNKNNDKLTFPVRCWNSQKVNWIFLEDTITGDKSTVFQYDPNSKHQCLEWQPLNSQYHKKARKSKSKVRQCSLSLLTSVGWSTKNFYLWDELSMQLSAKKPLRHHRTIKQKRPVITNHWKCYYDNTLFYIAFIVTAYLAQIGVATLL